MTVTQAKQRYSFAGDPDEWHRQPVCVCGDYICQHEDLPPHRCGFANGHRCNCHRYRYSRMGSGPSATITTGDQLASAHDRPGIH